MESENQILNKIKISQGQDLKLILDLKKLPTDNDSLNEQRKIITQMYENASERIRYFQQLNQMENILSQVSENQKLQMKDQKSHLELIEKNIKQQQDLILKNRNINISNLRASEINSYYSDKYRAFTNIIKSSLYVIFPLLILAGLKNESMIPEGVVLPITIFILVIAFFVFIPKILDLNKRNNMVFNEFDFKSMESQNWDDSNGEDTSGKIDDAIECVGPACCTAGMIYDNERELCIINPNNSSTLTGQSSSSTSEAFGSKI